MNVLTPVQRQLNMSRIRSRDTQPGWRVVMAWECALQGRTGLATGCALARVSNFIGTDTGMLLSVSGVEALSFPGRVLSGEIGNWCSDSSTRSAPASTKKSSVCFELSALARSAPGCQSQSPFEHVCKMADLQTLALSTPFASRPVDQPGER